MTISRTASKPVARMPRPTGDRRWAELRGRIAECLAAGLMIAKGYRILARRHRGPFGEIDLIAVRGRRLAFVEVKQRVHIEDAAAAARVASKVNRLENAVERWLGRNPAFREHRVGLDAVVLGATLLPRHIPDALHTW